MPAPAPLPALRRPRQLRAHCVRGGAWLALALVVLAGLGCTGPQSALDPAGREATGLATLFWVMLIGSGVVWIGVVALGIHAAQHQPDEHTARRARRLVIGGGVALPTVVLAVLLTTGMSQLPTLLAPAPEGSLRIHVTGEQYWWRVEYQVPGDNPIVLANEIRLPVGAPVQFELRSPDVIHAFWIPALGGKIDMIPGRTTRLTLNPTRVGEYRGVCAEFCGTSHAWMAFPVVVMQATDFRDWLEHQRAPAAVPAPAQVAAGAERFLSHGCGACHTVRGTPADGVVGPDLTHVGSRLSLGAGVLANEVGDFTRWLAKTEEIKPGVRMPHFGMLPREEVEALAAYLESLQ